MKVLVKPEFFLQLVSPGSLPTVWALWVDCSFIPPHQPSAFKANCEVKQWITSCLSAGEYNELMSCVEWTANQSRQVLIDDLLPEKLPVICPRQYGRGAFLVLLIHVHNADQKPSALFTYLHSEPHCCSSWLRDAPTRLQSAPIFKHNLIQWTEK